MNLFLFINLLISSFNMKYYINEGIYGGTHGRVNVCDSDHDSWIELIFARYENTQDQVVVYELYPDSFFHFQTIIDTTSSEAWYTGDLDRDNLFDIVLQGDFGLPIVGVQIYESPDSFSYPTQEVWRDTVGFALVTPICVYDIDKDSCPEIVKVCGYYSDLVIYESVGDDLYSVVTEITTACSSTASSNVAFADFDLDDQNEFIWGYTNGQYSIYECVGSDVYQEITLQQLPTSDIKDCFAVPDADGDGKPEFVLKGAYHIAAYAEPFIFEATGDNTYEVVKSFNLDSGDEGNYYGGHSEAGDVDGDSIPEICLEACRYVYILKSAGNDSFFVWDTLPGHLGGSDVRVFDIDNNGLAEIIISGSSETRIYEYASGGVAEIGQFVMQGQVDFLRVFPNPFSQASKIKFIIANSNSPLNSGSGRFNLDIFDVTGRLVKRFDVVYGNLPFISEVTWDGDDNQGHKVPTGIYFIRLKKSSIKLLKVK